MTILDSNCVFGLCRGLSVRMFFGVFMMLICISTISTGAAQEMNLTCQGAELGAYANLSFCLSPEISVGQGNVTEMNYSQGGLVTATLLLNDSKVGLHLLYPCEIADNLYLSEILAEVEAFDAEMSLANYSSVPLNISGSPSLWGAVKNQTFAAFQPANQTVALLIFDQNMSMPMVLSFLEKLQITINETMSPPKPCPPTIPETLPPLQSVSQAGYTSVNITNQETEAEARMARFEATREGLMQDLEETKESLGTTTERLLGNLEETKESLGATKERLQGLKMPVGPFFPN